MLGQLLFIIILYNLTHFRTRAMSEVNTDLMLPFGRSKVKVFHTAAGLVLDGFIIQYLSVWLYYGQGVII